MLQQPVGDGSAVAMVGATAAGAAVMQWRRSGMCHVSSARGQRVRHLPRPSQQLCTDLLGVHTRILDVAEPVEAVANRGTCESADAALVRAEVRQKAVERTEMSHTGVRAWAAIARPRDDIAERLDKACGLLKRRHGNRYRLRFGRYRLHRSGRRRSGQ